MVDTKKYGMANKKKYGLWYCRDCDIDFLANANKVKRKACCPKCGDSYFVEKFKNIWIPRPFNFKRPWTPEEDEIVIAGLKLGKKHKEIAEELPGRTLLAVRSRIYTLRERGLIA